MSGEERVYRDSFGSPINNGFYIGESYKAVFYCTKFSIQSRWGSYSEFYQHDLSTFEPLLNPEQYADELKRKGDRTSVEESEFILKKLEEIEDSKKREITETSPKVPWTKPEYSHWPSSSDRNRMSNYYLGYP